MAARKCYLAMMALDEQVQTMSIKERRVVTDHTEVLEDVLLKEDDLEKFTRIGTSMKEGKKRPRPVPEEEYRCFCVES